MFEHDDRLLLPPKGGTSKIWRYMGFSHFVSLLESQCLHFTRPNQFPDPFEGTVPRRMRDRLAKEHSDPNTVLGKNPTLPHDILAWLTCVNCWYVSDHESDAMWKLYSKNDEGIAIQSTFRRLTECFDSDRKLQINAGMIKYMDFEEDDLDDDEGFSTVFIKRNHFEHEKELRAIVYPVSDEDDEEIIDLNAPAEPVFPTGRKIPVNLETLIEAVYVSPVRQDWFMSLVQSVVKRYGHRFPIHHSEMAKLPSAYRQTTKKSL